MDIQRGSYRDRGTEIEVQSWNYRDGGKVTVMKIQRWRYRHGAKRCKYRGRGKEMEAQTRSYTRWTYT